MPNLRERQDEVQKRFVEFVERDPRPVFETDRQGRVLYANPSARDRFPDLQEKGPQHELLIAWPDLVARLDLEPLKPVSRTITAANRPFEEWIHRSPDGSRIRVHLQDVSERERDLEVIRRFDLIAQKVPEFMTLIGEGYVYLAANDAYCRAHKLRRESVIGRTVSQVWGEQVFRSVIKGHLDRCLAGVEVEHQLWIDFPGIGRRHVDVRYLPAREPVSDKPLAIVVTRDITRILESEEALRRREKRDALARMASGVARTLAEALSALDKRATPSSGVIGAAATDASLAGLRGLLDSLRTFADAPKPADAPYELGQVIAAAVQASSAGLPRHVKVRLESGNVPMLTGDARILEEILRRLIASAGRALHRVAGREEQITIESWQENEMVRIAIADTGPAIPDHLREAVFEPFLEGLGERSSFSLAICRTLAERIGGTLDLPVATGVGAHFILAIPLRTPTRQEADARNQPGKPLLTPRRRASLLVIDDEPAVASTIRSVVADEHDVTAFVNGQDALTHLARIPPVDIIFCDLMMPGMSGEEFYRAVDARWPDFAQRVIFLTGGLTSPQLDRFLASVPNRRCGKPLGAAALRKLISETLE